MVGSPPCWKRLTYSWNGAFIRKSTVDGALVAWHETLAEVPREIVVGGLRLGLDDAADRIGEARFMSRRGNAARMLFISSGGIRSYWAPEVETDPSRAERDFRLLVQSDRRCGIQSDAVPDQLYPAIVETLLARERSRGIGAFDLEAPWTREAIREPKVVEQRA